MRIGIDRRYTAVVALKMQPTRRYDAIQKLKRCARCARARAAWPRNNSRSLQVRFMLRWCPGSAQGRTRCAHPFRALSRACRGSHQSCAAGDARFQKESPVEETIACDRTFLVSHEIPRKLPFANRYLQAAKRAINDAGLKFSDVELMHKGTARPFATR